MTFGVGGEDAITRITSGMLDDNEVGGHRDTAAVVTLNNPLDQSPLIIGGEFVMILAGYTRDHNGPN